MFDIGFSELLVIALVALVVLGPERLPKAARMAGMWMRRARMQWQAVKSELENELADDDMRRSILRARDELREAQESLRADGARLRAQLADVEARMTDAPPAQPAIDAPLQPIAPHADAATARMPAATTQASPSQATADEIAPAHGATPAMQDPLAPARDAITGTAVPTSTTRADEQR